MQRSQQAKVEEEEEGGSYEIAASDRVRRKAEMCESKDEERDNAANRTGRGLNSRSCRALRVRLQDYRRLRNFRSGGVGVPIRSDS